MDKIELRKVWEQRIKEFKASGQNQTKWCASHDLNIHQLRYWIRKFNSSDTVESQNVSNSNWVPIAIDEQIGTRSYLSVKIGEVTIEIKPGYDPALFLDVVKKLKSLC